MKKSNGKKVKGVSENTPWMSVVDVAKYIGVSKEKIYRLIDESGKNTIPKCRVGKLWKFHRDKIDQWIQENAR